MVIYDNIKITLEHVDTMSVSELRSCIDTILRTRFPEATRIAFETHNIISGSSDKANSETILQTEYR